MKCPSCGRENRTAAEFCAWCGASLKAEVEPESQRETPPAEEPAAPAAPASMPQPPPVEPEAAPEQPEVAAEEEEEPSAGGETPEAAPVVEPPAGAPASPASGPLAPGARLYDRFELVELLQSTPDANTYRARDLLRCAHCGYDDNMPGDTYCRECGGSLEDPAYVTVVEQIRRAPEHYEERFSEDDRDYYVTAEPASPPPASPASDQATPIRLTWGRATDQGKQRDHNEDYLEAWLYTRGSGSVLGLFVVADGLGGQDSGEVASQLATNTLWEALRTRVWEPALRGEGLEDEALRERLKAGIQAANQAVYDARISRHSEMSTTVTTALIVDGMAYIGNVGDSRTYVYNGQGLQRITHDHSLVQRLVDAGEIKPEEIYSHPQRNLIYQSIGDRPQVQADIYTRRLQPDDRLILCSDGLWEMVHDEGLEEVLLAETDPQRACDRLVQNANLAGGEDNISIIIVQALKA